MASITIESGLRPPDCPPSPGQGLSDGRGGEAVSPTRISPTTPPNNQWLRTYYTDRNMKEIVTDISNHTESVFPKGIKLTYK